MLLLFCILPTYQRLDFQIAFKSNLPCQFYHFENKSDFIH